MPGVVSRRAIETRAYYLFVQRGRENGHDIDDWLEAERELLVPYGRRSSAGLSPLDGVTDSSRTLLPQPSAVPQVTTQSKAVDSGLPTLATRDHVLIKGWAAARAAEPATGERTLSGPATINVTDGGAGLRFNFPGNSRFRQITWAEWFDQFDQNRLVFVYENDGGFAIPSHRYRLVPERDLYPEPNRSDEG